MEWAAGAVVVGMFALYIWSAIPAKRALHKHLQPLIDDLFGTHRRKLEANKADDDFVHH
jgi:hypothetical protein